MVTSAPAIAATGSTSNGTLATMRSPTTMASAEAKPAPGEMPASIGSASGLRNRPCITVPPAASSAPIITASAMRGNRTDHSTSWSRAVSAASSPCTRPSAAGRRRSGMPAAPTVAAIAAAATSAMTSAPMTSSG